MKIIFNSIKIENFLSIGSAEISLKDRGYCLVNGINKNPNDSAKSNGSGKSSIFEAIAWCLTGETIRGAKNIVNMFTTEGALVELEFQVDQNNYKLIRSKDHSKYKTDLKIYVNGEDKSGKTLTDSKKLLSNYLPDLTSSLVGSVILLGQGLPQRFTNNTPSGRKEVLEKLSKSDFMIEDLKRRLQERKIYLNKELRCYEDTLLSLSSTITSLNNQILQSKTKLESMGSVDAYDEIINRASEKISYLNSKIEGMRDTINDNRSKLDNIRNEKLKIEALILNELNLKSEELINDKVDINIKISSVKASISQLEKIIRDAQNVKDTCPTCGQKLPDVFKPNTQEEEISLINNKNLLNEFNNALKFIESKIDNLKNEYRIKSEENTKELTFKINELIANIQSEEKALAILNNDKESENSILSKYNSLKASYQATVNLLNKTIEDNTLQIEELNKKTVYNMDEKNKVLSKLDVINKFITVTNRDFRGYLLKNVISFINNKAKEYCQEVFNNNNIQFMLDGNNIDIKYFNKEYEVLSGGEKQKIDMIIQLALRDMLCQFLDFRSNIIAFDEIFDNMDVEGCDKIINLISKKLSDVGSVFIVTHHQDLNIPNDNTITIIKQENGVSTIV